MKTHSYPIQLALVLLFTSSPGDLQAQEKSTNLPNFDIRQTNRTKSPQLDSTRESALNRLQARIPGLKINLDEVVVSPKFIYNELGFLSGPSSEGEILNPRTLQSPQQPKADDPQAPIKRFLNENADLFGYDATILDSARISREYVTAHSGMRTFVWEQQLDGIPIFEAELYGHITKNGELVSLCSQFVPNPAQAADAGVPNRATAQTSPPVSTQEAVANAATNITERLRPEDVTAVDAVPEGPAQKRRFTAPALLGDATTSLVWLPMDRNAMRLCWRVILTGKTRGELFQVLVDAQTGSEWRWFARRPVRRDRPQAGHGYWSDDGPVAMGLRNLGVVVQRAIEAIDLELVPDVVEGDLVDPFRFDLAAEPGRYLGERIRLR